jgi:hypothetical protein
MKKLNKIQFEIYIKILEGGGGAFLVFNKALGESDLINFIS